MKTNSSILETLMVTLLLAPVAYITVVWKRLPAEIATHFDWSGKPNDWMPKETATLTLVGLSIGLYLLFRFLPYIDPKRKLQSSNFQKIRLLISFLLATLIVWTYFKAANPETNMSTVGILAVVGIFVAGLGNYMLTVKPNWFVGIRTPWTLESETVWRKTHRLGGRLLVVAGLLTTLLAFLVPMPYTAGIVVGILVLASLIPVVYSYIYFREEKAHLSN